MPTIPGYNQWATEEAGLTRAKRRVLKNMQSGIVKLTEKPDVDVSNGSADQIAGRLITLYEDLTVTLRQMLAYAEEADTDRGNLLKAVSYAIVSARTVSRIYRLVNQLLPVMRYMDLGILSDLKAAKSETDELITGALFAIGNLEFTRDELKDILRTVPEMNLDDYDPPDDSTRNTPSLRESDFDPSEDDMSVMSDISSRSSRSRRTSRSTLSREASLFNRLVAAYDELGSVSSDSSLSTTVDSIRGSEEIDPSVLSRLIGRYDDMSDISSLTGTAPRDSTQLFSQVLKRTSYLYGKASDLLNLGFQTFNAFRQQRVLPAKSDVADVSNAIRTGAGVYRIGGSSDIYQKIDRFV